MALAKHIKTEQKLLLKPMPEREGVQRQSTWHPIWSTPGRIAAICDSPMGKPPMRRFPLPGSCRSNWKKRRCLSVPWLRWSG